MPTDVQKTPPIPLGEIIAERRFTLFERSGDARQVVIQIGRPVATDLQGNLTAVEQETFRCPLCIDGLEIDSRIFAPFGTDSIQALQYAIGLAGQVLDEAVQRLDLINPLDEVRQRRNPGQQHYDATGYPEWLFRYDSRPNFDYGLWERES